MKFGFVFLFLVSFALHGHETPILKIVYAGSYLIVPQHEEWHIQRVLINDGGAYNIEIAKANFKEVYRAGDTIHAPYYLAEMEVLTHRELVQYQLYFDVKIMD